MTFRHLSGLESILCYDDNIDVAELTRHTEQCGRDLELVKATGLSWFRYPWRWHAIERWPGRYETSFCTSGSSQLTSNGISTAN